MFSLQRWCNNRCLTCGYWTYYNISLWHFKKYTCSLFGGKVNTVPVSFPCVRGRIFLTQDRVKHKRSVQNYRETTFLAVLKVPWTKHRSFTTLPSSIWTHSSPGEPLGQIKLITRTHLQTSSVRSGMIHERRPRLRRGCAELFPTVSSWVNLVWNSQTDTDLLIQLPVTQQKSVFPSLCFYSNTYSSRSYLWSCRSLAGAGVNNRYFIYLCELMNTWVFADFLLQPAWCQRFDLARRLLSVVSENT